MANYFNLTLDTLAPSISSFTINAGQSITSNRSVTLAIGCSDSDVTAMKIWGYDGCLTEADASWETYNASKVVNLPDSDGQHTLYVKVRDDVYNESTASNATITLSTELPTITITGPDVVKISEVNGKNVATFSFTSDVALKAYKVKVVPTQNSAHDTGTQMGTTHGSTNMTGTTVAAGATGYVSVLDTELTNGDGNYLVAVYGRNEGGQWNE